MIYIISDIHGLYDRYLQMLKKINFSAEDKLYILGDVIDRGNKSIEILFDIMERDNVELFLGNHEHMMLTYLNGTDTRTWFYDANGGRHTYEQFMELDENDRNRIVDYLYDTTVLRNLEINNHKYILSHTSALLGCDDIYTKDHKDNLMAIQDIVWNQYPYDIEGLAVEESIDETIILISGHIISRRLHDSDDIYVKDFGNGYIWMDIDCGCAMGENYGQLSCIAIDHDGEIVAIEYAK